MKEWKPQATNATLVPVFDLVTLCIFVWMPDCAGITGGGYQAGIHENTAFRIEPALDLIGYSGTTVVLFQKIFRGEEI
jgi:hypothetical protein